MYIVESSCVTPVDPVFFLKYASLYCHIIRMDTGRLLD